MATRRAGEQDTAGLLAAVVLVCALTTVALTFVPFPRLAYRAVALHASLETANALVTLLVAYLVHGRYRSGGRRLQDLLLTIAFCTVATANLALTALPAALAAGHEGGATDHAATATRLLGVVVLAAAAVVPRRVVVRRRLLLPVTGSVAALVVAALAVAATTAVPAPAPPSDGELPLVSDPLFLGAQAVGGLLFAVAATALTVKTVRYGDDLLRWLAAACAVGVFARFHYLLYPSLYSEYVYSGDLLRFASHVLLLIGAAREIRSYRTSAGPPAGADEARRSSTTST